MAPFYKPVKSKKSLCARVPTDEQNPELQRQALQSAGCEIIYEDRGVSGASEARKSFLEALERIGEGLLLVVWKLDRLGRSLAHLIYLSVPHGINRHHYGRRKAGFSHDGSLSEV